MDEQEQQEPQLCDECGQEIPEIDGGSISNRHHGESCSLYDPARA